MCAPVHDQQKSQDPVVLSVAGILRAQRLPLRHTPAGLGSFVALSGTTRPDYCGGHTSGLAWHDGVRTARGHLWGMGVDLGDRYVLDLAGFMSRPPRELAERD